MQRTPQQLSACGSCSGARIALSTLRDHHKQRQRTGTPNTPLQPQERPGRRHICESTKRKSRVLSTCPSTCHSRAAHSTCRPTPLGRWRGNTTHTLRMPGPPRPSPWRTWQRVRNDQPRLCSARTAQRAARHALVELIVTREAVPRLVRGGEAVVVGRRLHLLVSERAAEEDRCHTSAIVRERAGVLIAA